MKYLIAFLVITLSLSSEVNRNVCDETGKWYCPDHFNCCKLTKREGYSCCYETKACTSDGEHCYLFSLKKGKMDQTPAMAAIEQAELVPNSIPNIPPDIEELLMALLKKIGVFDNYPKTCTCIKEAPPLIKPIVTELIEKIRSIRTAQQFLSVMIEIWTVYYPKIMASYWQKCEFAPQEIKDAIFRIKEIITQPGYLDKLLTNLRTNVNPILRAIKNLVLSVRNNKMTDAGTYLGEILVIIFKTS